MADRRKFEASLNAKKKADDALYEAEAHKEFGDVTVSEYQSLLEKSKETTKLYDVNWNKLYSIGGNEEEQQLLLDIKKQVSQYGIDSQKQIRYEIEMEYRPETTKVDQKKIVASYASSKEALDSSVKDLYNTNTKWDPQCSKLILLCFQSNNIESNIDPRRCADKDYLISIWVSKCLPYRIKKLGLTAFLKHAKDKARFYIEKPAGKCKYHFQELFDADTGEFVDAPRNQLANRHEHRMDNQYTTAKAKKKKRPTRRAAMVSAQNPLAVLFSKQGLCLVPIPRDGNCLFGCLSDQIDGDKGAGHLELRNNVCDFIEKNRKEFVERLLCDDDDEEQRNALFDNLIVKSRQPGIWKNDLMDSAPYAAALLLGRPINLYNTRGNLMFTLGDGDEKSDPAINLLRHDTDGAEHFDSLQPLIREEQDVALPPPAGEDAKLSEPCASTEKLSLRDPHQVEDIAAAEEEAEQSPAGEDSKLSEPYASTEKLSLRDPHQVSNAKSDSPLVPAESPPSNSKQVRWQSPVVHTPATGIREPLSGSVSMSKARFLMSTSKTRRKIRSEKKLNQKKKLSYLDEASRAAAKAAEAKDQERLAAREERMAARGKFDAYKDLKSLANKKAEMTDEMKKALDSKEEDVTQLQGLFDQVALDEQHELQEMMDELGEDEMEPLQLGF